MKLKPDILNNTIINQGNKTCNKCRDFRFHPKYILMVFLLIVFTAKSYSNNIGINFSAVMQPTYLNNQFSLITGGKVGLNITPEIFLGLALYGTTLFKNKVDAIDPLVIQRPVLELSYYGLDVEYYFKPKNMYHFSISAFAGWSNIFFNIPPFEDTNKVRYKPDYFNGKSSLILKPSVNLNLNIKDFYRIVVGVSYRYFPGYEYNVKELVNVSDNMPYKITSEELDGFAINVAVRFGGF